MNEYSALGSFYDRLMTDDNGKERAEYLSSLFKHYAGKMPKTLLDLACGTGNMCVEFASRGLDIVGVDNSEEMLSFAFEKAKAFTDKILLLKQDMRALDLNDTVDGGICVLDGLNHLTSRSDLDKLFDRLRLFIAPKVLFIFDVNTPWKQQHVLGNHSFVMEEKGLLCSWQNEYHEKTGITDMYLDFFEEKEEGTYARYSDFVRERAYSKTVWENVLKRHEFQLEAILDDKTLNPASDTAERWVIVARNMRDEKEFLGE